jgi:hypothetical protein
MEIGGYFVLMGFAVYGAQPLREDLKRLTLECNLGFFLC